MKYQLADLVNGQYGEEFTDKAVADQALEDAIAEGKRINLENSGGESDMGSYNGKPQSVEDFISLVEIQDRDINKSKVTDIEVMKDHGFVVVRFSNAGEKFSMAACLESDTDKPTVKKSDSGMTWGNCGDTNGEAFESFGQEAAMEWFFSRVDWDVEVI